MTRLALAAALLHAATPAPPATLPATPAALPSSTEPPVAAARPPAFAAPPAEAAIAPPTLAPARPIAAFLLTAPLHLGATLGATWLASRAVTSDGDGSFAGHLTGLRDRDEPAQVLFVGTLVLGAPALSALAPWALVESQPGLRASYPAIWAAGAAGQLAGLGIVAASDGTTGVVLSVALVAAAEVAAAILTAGPEAP